MIPLFFEDLFKCKKKPNIQILCALFFVAELNLTGKLVSEFFNLML